MKILSDRFPQGKQNKQKPEPYKLDPLDAWIIKQFKASKLRGKPLLMLLKIGSTPGSPQFAEALTLVRRWYISTN